MKWIEMLGMQKKKIKIDEMNGEMMNFVNVRWRENNENAKNPNGDFTYTRRNFRLVFFFSFLYSHLSLM